MIRLTLTLTVLLLWGSASRIEAQGDTKIMVGDGGSLRLHADNLDAGNTWTWSKTDIRHKDSAGVLSRVVINDKGADRCGGRTDCGVDLTKAWKIQVTYGAASLTLASISYNKGLKVTQSNLPFDKFQPNGTADEREFGHGDGLHITSIKVNNGANLCSANGCDVTLYFSPRLQ